MEYLEMIDSVFYTILAFGILYVLIPFLLGIAIHKLYRKGRLGLISFIVITFIGTFVFIEILPKITLVLIIPAITLAIISLVTANKQDSSKSAVLSNRFAIAGLVIVLASIIMLIIIIIVVMIFAYLVRDFSWPT